MNVINQEVDTSQIYEFKIKREEEFNGDHEFTRTYQKPIDCSSDKAYTSQAEGSTCQDGKGAAIEDQNEDFLEIKIEEDIDYFAVPSNDHSITAYIDVSPAADKYDESVKPISHLEQPENQDTYRIGSQKFPNKKQSKSDKGGCQIPNMFLCHWKECKLSFTMYDDFEAHIKETHASVKPHKCDSCEKSFMTKSGITAHKLSHEKEFQCKECEKILSTKDSLKRHAMCHQEKKFVCSKCEKRFTTNSSLQLHDNEIHKKIELYKCSMCGKGYYRKSEYNNHMKAHNDIKPLQCEKCNKCFQHKRDLKRHSDSHLGLKPYKCNICGRCFPNTRNLRRHCKALHKDVKDSIGENYIAK